MAYRLMKRIIERGGYEKADVMDKLDTYYATGRLTREQYEELMGMVNPQPAANESEGE